MTDQRPPEMFYPDEAIKQVQEGGALKYRSPRLPTWCPGCGYFGIQNAIYRAVNDLAIPTHELLLVSGIGCTGRFPFFGSAYGVHSLHGRALPVATGAKASRPDLKVIVLTGDGDCMGIGAGHLPHACRRNLDLTCVLFDNNIYGLTKGQTSPTTPITQKTNSHPYGSPDTPLDPVRMVLAMGATFVARGWAGAPYDLQVIINEAIKHKGFSFVHALSPCITFDKVNLLYPRVNDLVMPLPKRHDFTDLHMAVERAMDPELFVGLFYQGQRPTFGEQMKDYAGRSKGE